MIDIDGISSSVLKDEETYEQNEDYQYECWYGQWFNSRRWIDNPMFLDQRIKFVWIKTWTRLTIDNIILDNLMVLSD